MSTLVPLDTRPPCSLAEYAATLTQLRGQLDHDHAHAGHVGKVDTAQARHNALTRPASATRPPLAALLRAAAYEQHAARCAATYADAVDRIRAGKGSPADEAFVTAHEAHLAERADAAAVRDRLGFGEVTSPIEVTPDREYRTPRGLDRPDLRAPAAV